jgi:hypothetical protein
MTNNFVAIRPIAAVALFTSGILFGMAAASPDLPSFIFACLLLVIVSEDAKGVLLSASGSYRMRWLVWRRIGA